MSNKIAISKLTPHARNNELPQLTDEERNGLKRLIEIYGFTDPIEITKKHVILDGHNRVSVATELGMKDLPFRIIDIEPKEEFAYILDKNSSRRQMTSKKIAYLRGKLYETKKGSGGNASETIAKEDKVSPKTVRRDADFAKKLDDVTIDAPELKEKILNNEVKATKQDLENLVDLEPKERQEIIKKVEETKDIGKAYKELHGQGLEADKNAPNFKTETLKMDTTAKLLKIESVLVNKVKNVTAKKKLHTAFKSAIKKIESIISDDNQDLFN